MLNNKQHGVGLVELLIGIFVGILVLTGMIYFLSHLSGTATKAVKSIRLEHELQTAMDLMAHDIRRAGYWSNASSILSSGVNTNPFMSSTTDISTPSPSCILFTYDLNKDGSLPALNTAGSDERYGYRLTNGIIQTRAVTDSTLNCNAGTWENLTSSTIAEITSLIFTLTPTAVALTSPATTETIVIRYVTISVTGRLIDDHTVIKTLSTNIRVRNDKYTQ